MRKAAVVLGAGRSATSAVAKGLHLAGFPMGSPMLGQSSSQPHGHYEHKPLISLNNQILAELGWSWDDPPPAETVEHSAGRFVDRCADYIRSRGPGQFGMKDPRCTVLWPVWRPAFARFNDIDLITVTVHRTPERAAQSLTARDGTDYQTALRITRIYQERLARWVTGGHHA